MIASLIAMVCSGAAVKAEPPASPAAKASVHVLKIRDPSGRLQYSLKVIDNRARLYDVEENELGRFEWANTAKGRELKIKTPGEVILGYVVGSQDHWALLDAKHDRVQLAFRKDAKGNYRLDDIHGNRVYQIKRRPYGYEVEDANLMPIFKLKAKPGRISLRNPADQELRYTTDSVRPEAFLFFGFEKLTLMERSALFIVEQDWSPLSTEGK